MDNHNACETAWLNGYKCGREAVEKKGPIDVAIVVRCKDCINRHCSEFCECRPDDFYCADGERK